MKKSCRILISQTCGYSCEYCCNKIPGMLDMFTDIDMQDVLMVANYYDTVCLSGGEPLHPSNIALTTSLTFDLKRMNKRVFVYTNLSNLPTVDLIHMVDGWTVGFHPSQTKKDDFHLRVLRLKALNASNIRVLVEDNKINLLKDLEPYVQIKTWERDKCDKTDIEDWYKLSF